MIKLIQKISPILNSNCQLDFLDQKSRETYKGNNFRKQIGKCFNDHLYFQMSKGLLGPEILEMMSTNDVFGCTPIMAPSLQIRSLYPKNPEKQNQYLKYYQQIFANIHDGHAIANNLKSEKKEVDKDLEKFYESINLDFSNFLETQKNSL